MWGKQQNTTLPTVLWQISYYIIWYDMIWYDMIWYDMIYLLTAIGLIPSGSGTVHIYTQTVHGTTQITTEQHN